jgi:hypothetical protein
MWLVDKTQMAWRGETNHNLGLKFGVIIIIIFLIFFYYILANLIT